MSEMYEISLEPPEPTINGKLLVPLIDLYVQQKAKKLKPETMVNYGFLLDRFCEWWQDVGPLHDWVLSPSLLSDYNEWLKTYNLIFAGKRANRGHFYSKCVR